MFAAACGLALVLLSLLSANGLYGTGYAQARDILQGHGDTGPFFGALKFLGNIASSWAGIPGGIFSPALAVGAGLGSNIAHFLPGSDVSSVVLLGMAAYLAGVTQAPLTAAVISLELTANRQMALPIMAACLLARALSSLVCRVPVYKALAENLIAQYEEERMRRDAPSANETTADAKPLPVEPHVMTLDHRWDHLLLDVGLATLADNGAPYGAIEDGAIAWRDGRIVFAGPREELQNEPHALAHRVESLPGTWVTPGLIDCHTHLVFGGDRAQEFERRLEGATYEEIARAGGGIVSSVRATRAASEDDLLRQSLPRARALLADGVTTLEIKSGYGLEPETERRMLRVARRIGNELRRGRAHELPRPARACRRSTPAAATNTSRWSATSCCLRSPRKELVDAVDAFCEGIGFTHEETRRLFEKATELGLPVKLHAEQLSDLGGAALVASHGGLSADHLEWISEDGVRAMADAGTVAVLLPGAYYALRDTRPPPVDAFRRHGVRHGRRHRPQSGHVAPAVPAHGDGDGLHPLPPHPRGSLARRDRERRACPRPRRSMAASPWACVPISRSWNVGQLAGTELLDRRRPPQGDLDRRRAHAHADNRRTFVASFRKLPSIRRSRHLSSMLPWR